MPSDPFVLGFDTSAAHCAAALLCAGELRAEAHEDMARGQAERLMPLLEEVLKQANTTWSTLNAIGVCTGPGNFTGIRISVAAARGVALGLGCPAIGVTLFEALLLGTDDSEALPVVAAPRDHLYVGPDRSAPACLVSVAEAVVIAGGRQVICATDKTALEQAGLRVLRPAFAVAEATARVAAARLGETPALRPAPLYLRPADAAPARDAAPLILP